MGLGIGHSGISGYGVGDAGHVTEFGTPPGGHVGTCVGSLVGEYVGATVGDALGRGVSYGVITPTCTTALAPRSPTAYTMQRP